ncbi:18941_t:CDS:1 [Acaulospora morrowiae]|uniref:18941_t:CDS:1 n=1 Tax=Acaulospora morrowiae TaxID=94023 RepID=A0A9N9B797_9GLOM|nr:18941_t:CDS:1 [Acaulospora morrowiae]
MEDFRKKLYEDIIIKQISRNNDVETAHKCIETLSRVVNNIIDSPNDERKRRLKEKSKTFQSNICGAQGGVEFLVKIGFRAKVIDFEKFYVLEHPLTDNPDSPEMEKLKVAQEILQDFLKKVKDRAELASKMQAKEKAAEESRRKAVLEKIDEDKERRVAARERLRARRKSQEEQETTINEESNSVDDTADTPSQPEQFYRAYHSSHYRQHNQKQD